MKTDIKTFARAAQPAFERLFARLGERERYILALSRRVITGVELDPETASHVVVLAVIDEDGVYRVLASAQPVMPKIDATAN